jgi:hypothetical protein
MAGLIEVPTLDATESTDDRGWVVEVLTHKPSVLEGVALGTLSHWEKREVAGAELVVIGGALVVRDRAGALIEALGPGTWRGVQRSEDVA